MSLLQIPWLVKVCMESCPYFQLACPRDVYHVVPAGASVPVRIRFSPAENKVRLEEPKHRMISTAIVFPALWLQPVGRQPAAVTPWQLLAGTAARPDRLCFPSLHIPEHCQGKMQREQDGNDRGLLIDVGPSLGPGEGVSL